MAVVRIEIILHMNKSLICVALLLVAAFSQICPFCESGACSFVTLDDPSVSTGVSTCSQCAAGALVNLTLINSTIPIPHPNVTMGWNMTIGVCQPCNVGCKSCHFGTRLPYQGEYYASVCDECDTNWIKNTTSGLCIPKPANCDNATYNGEGAATGLFCNACNSGYTLSAAGCVYTGTATLEHEDQVSQGSGVEVALSVWGALCTIAVVVFLGLWVRERRKNATPLAFRPQKDKYVSFN